MGIKVASSLHAKHSTLPLSNILEKSNMVSTCFNIVEAE